ncbi:hypothetical protein B0T13DRAFT_178610 [Neurospora crassa]|nr:hypothetical protein B0T13DRAFT_178610 [Neurospora crassa]
MAFTMAGPTERLKITTFNFQATPRREFWPRRSGCLPMWCMLWVVCQWLRRLHDSAPQHAISLGPGSDLRCVVCGGLSRTPSLFSTTRLCPQTVHQVSPGQPRACLVRHKRTGNRLEDAGISESRSYLRNTYLMPCHLPTGPPRVPCCPLWG